MSIDLARRMALDGLLSDEELSAVIARRVLFDEPVPVALLSLRIASASAVESLFDRMGYAVLRRIRATDAASRLPRGMIRSLWAVPIGETDEHVVVAMVDPLDSHATRELEYHLGKPVDPRVAPIHRIRTLIAELDPPPAGRSQPASDAAARVSTRPPARASVPGLPAVRPRGRAGSVPSLGAVTQAPPLSTPAYGQMAPAKPVQIPALGRSRRTSSAPRRPGSNPKITPPSRGTIDGVGHPKRASTPPAPDRNARTLISEPPVALTRRVTRTNPGLSREALRSVTELRRASDRDEIGRIAVQGMLGVASRAAFFVLRRGVIQGWDARATTGSQRIAPARTSLQNLWIPATSPSIFKRAIDTRDVYVGPIGASTADSILTSTFGSVPDPLLVAPVIVKGRCAALVYADGIARPDEARERAEQIAAGVAEALERIVAGPRTQ